MKQKLADLHTHSIYSDGCNLPEEILALAIAKNIDTLAITDHDNLEGSKKLINLSKGKITAYSGVELTIKYKQGRMHLLGYNIDLNNEKLNKILKEIHESSIYNLILYKKIIEKDYQIKFIEEDVDKLINSFGNKGRPDLAKLLVKYGYCKDIEDAFQKYLIPAYEKARKIKKGISLEEGVELIHNAGGVAIIAHPSSLEYTEEEFAKEIKKFISIGIDGLETRHYKFSPHDSEFYHSIAKKHGLLESGGTDFHGIEIKPDVEIGTGKNNNVYIPSDSLLLTKNIKSRYM